MTSFSEDTITRLTPSLDLQDDTYTDSSQDFELALDAPLPDISPSISPISEETISRPIGTRIDTLLPLQNTGVKRKRKRRVMRQSDSIQLDSVSVPASSRPLPPLETDGTSVRPISPNDPLPLVPLHPTLQTSYEPIRLLSEEDVYPQNDGNTPGNTITQQSEFLMKSEKAFFERKDGKFTPVTKQEIEPVPRPACPSLDTFSRRATLTQLCNSIFNTTGLISHSLLAGITIWHTVFVFTLASYNNLDLNIVSNLSKLSLPSHSLLYFLFAVTLVYLADRVDIPRLNRKYIIEALHRRKIVVLLNIIALFLTSISLVLSLSLMYIDLQIHYISMPDSIGWHTLWTDLITNSSVEACPTIVYSFESQSYYPVDVPVSGRVTVLKIFLFVRSVLCAFSWLMVVSCPSYNRWYLYVKRVLREKE